MARFHTLYSDQLAQLKTLHSSLEETQSVRFCPVSRAS